MKYKNNKNIIGVSILLLLLVPFMLNILMFIPNSDDIGGLTEINIVSAAKNATEMYLTWGGAWVISFLQNFLHPLAYFPLGSYLAGIEMIIFFMLLVFALIFLIYNICRLFKENNTTWSWISLLVITAILNAGHSNEIFTWFIGSCYGWLMTFFCLAMSFMIRVIFSEKTKPMDYILLFVFALLAGEGLNYAGTACIIYFLCLLKKKKNIFFNALPLIILFISALSVAFAPGSFARHNVIGTELSVTKALIFSIINFSWRQACLFVSPVVIFSLILVAVISYIFTEKTKPLFNPFYALIIYIMCMLSVLFPVAYGYGGIGLPERMIWIFNTISILLCSIWAINFGIWLAQKNNNLFKENNLVIAALVMLIVACIGLNSPYKNQVEYLRLTAKCHQEWNYVFNQIKNTSETSVLKINVTDRKLLECENLCTPLMKGNIIRDNFGIYYGKEKENLEVIIISEFDSSSSAGTT